MAIQDEYTRTWIIQNALEVIKGYEKGILTIRGLHYRLVARGMTNDIQHYKRVGAAMTEARKEYIIPFDTFSDWERSMLGTTDYKHTDLDDSIANGKKEIRAWMQYFSRNRWEGQPNYVEVLIEKKALQGVFESVTKLKGVTLGACKGYPSLTFLYDAANRFKAASDAGFNPIILYFGDYDPSGEDIPRSIEENMKWFGVDDIEVRRIALMKEQVIEWNLPPAPIKEGDSRSAKWNGLGQVELDAVEPKALQQLCYDAIESVFDESIHDELEEEEAIQQIEYQLQLKEFVQSL